MNNIKVETQDSGIQVITLNRPDKLNALNADTLSELQQAFGQAKEDNKVKGLLLTGEGKAFCAGADINQLAELNESTGLEFAQSGQAVFNALENLGKPSIAAVNGPAFGGGCELAMSATLRIASNKALFGQPEVKLGVIPGYGGTQRLSRLVGKGRALDLCLTSRFIKAEEALSWGLVSAVTESDALFSESSTMLQTILDMGPLAVAHTMEVIHQGFDLPLADALKLEAKHFSQCCATEDKQEGVNAFLGKRKADFKGN